MKTKCVLFTLALFLLSSSSAFARMEYQCYSYKNGKPDKMVKVLADSNAEAVKLAWDKFKKLDIKAESVNCK